MRRALLLAFAPILAACPPSSPPPASSPTYDASDAALAPAGACALLCANLATIGCRPRASCPDDCDFARSKHLVDEGELACASRATSPDAVHECGGRWCR